MSLQISLTAEYDHIGAHQGGSSARHTTHGISADMVDCSTYRKSENLRMGNWWELASAYDEIPNLCSLSVIHLSLVPHRTLSIQAFHIFHAS